MAELPEKATHRQTRTFNQQLVLRAIYDASQTSRAETARTTGLTRTSVSAIVSGLLRDGLVEEVGRGPSTGGKAPILLRVRQDARHAIGLDLGEAEFSGALVDLRGNVVSSARVALDGRTGNDAVSALLDLIELLSSRNGAAGLLGIGIGAPGVVDSRTGTVRWAVNLDWTQLPLATLVRERFGVPVVVTNDSQAAAVAEITYGAVRWPANLIVLRVGLGIGAGIVLSGKLYQGEGSGAGEIGHTALGMVDSGTPPAACRCGRTGCLETIASIPAMVRAAQRVQPAVTDEASLIAAFHSGDRLVCDVVLRAGRILGEAIAALVATLNINRIVLIGPAIALGDEWLAAVRRQMNASALPLLARDTVVELGRERADDVVVGASALLMTQELGLSLAR